MSGLGSLVLWLKKAMGYWECLSLSVRPTDRPCVRLAIHPSICPSHYLLINLWAEFCQTCYITFPHGKGVQEQHYFFVHPSVHPSFVYLFVTLSPPKPLGGIQPNLLHHFPSWLGCARPTLYFCASIRLCILLSHYLLIHWAEF